MDDNTKKPSALEYYVEALAGLMEHANQEDHIPECPFSKESKEKRQAKGVSTGASSSAYRSGWDAVFGKGRVGEA